jgi:hypothetical protein
MIALSASFYNCLSVFAGFHNRANPGDFSCRRIIGAVMPQKEGSMNQTSILITSMTIGFVRWAIIANLWLIPWLKNNPFHKGLALLTIPHVFRYIGLSFLITGVTTSPLDPRFAAPAAYGDLIAAVLAYRLFQICSVHRKFLRVPKTHDYSG